MPVLPEKPLSIKTLNTSKEYIQDYQKKIDFWEDKAKEAQERYFEKSFDSSAPDVLEFVLVRKFMNQFLKKRFMDIQCLPDEIQKKYLQVLPPFYFQDDIPRFISHFFQLHFDSSNFYYQGRTEIERELNILLDVYKVRKTIRTLSVLKRAVEGPNPFKSILPKEKQIECLVKIREVFQLLFKRCIKQEYQKDLYQNISTDIISPKAILKRKQEGFSYVQPHVVAKYDYRQQFFFMYFTEGMRAKVNGQICDFTYNYLDFEIIKQEFLVDWAVRKLEDNPEKLKVYKKYIIDGETFDTLIKKIPAKELELLKLIPLNYFNDITSEINEKVDKHLKTEVDPMSEKVGEYSGFLSVLKQAKGLAKSSVGAIKKAINNEEEIKEEPPAEQKEPEPQPEQKSTKPKISITKLKKNELDFHYFDKSVSKYSTNLARLKMKLGGNYQQFSKLVNNLLTNMPESLLITRRTPKHDWILPYLVEETTGEKTTSFLIIIGAEAKTKSLGMGYSNAKGAAAKYTFIPYFVFATDDQSQNYGSSIDTRNVKGKLLDEYNYMSENVNTKVMQLIEKVFKANQKST